MLIKTRNSLNSNLKSKKKKKPKEWEENLKKISKRMRITKITLLFLHINTLYKLFKILCSFKIFYQMQTINKSPTSLKNLKIAQLPYKKWNNWIRKRLIHKKLKSTQFYKSCSEIYGVNIILSTNFHIWVKTITNFLNKIKKK